MLLLERLLVILLHDLGVIDHICYILYTSYSGIVRCGSGRGDDGGARCKSDHCPTASLGHLALLKLLLEHGLPDSPPGVGEPVLELLLVDAGFLHKHDLVLRRGVGVGEVLR